MPRILRRLVRVLIFLVVCVSTAPARTLTSLDGRAIEVEILGFEGKDKVRFKRADSGQIFTVPFTVFSEADQKALETEAAEAAKPPAIHAGDVVLEFTRFRLDARRVKQNVRLSDGGVARGGIEVVNEDCGYTFSLRNLTNFDLEGLRAEYVLFCKLEEPPVTVTDSLSRRLGQASGKITFETLPANGRISAKSDTVTLCKTELKGAIYNPDDNNGKTRDTLEGVWVRVYRGDELVLETASPVGIMTKERWPTLRP